MVYRNHSATKHLPDYWKWFGEWYVNTGANLNESTYEGGSYQMVSQCHEFHGGKDFYITGEYPNESYTDSLFL
ncbi:ThuA domain-containing protein [Pontibacter silvestris]|nr:ThuA domain-containing protein [Pontibacter silvestris]